MVGRWFRGRPGDAGLPPPPFRVAADEAALREAVMQFNPQATTPSAWLVSCRMAEQLFFEHLDAEQKQQFKEACTVDVQGSSTRRIYTIALHPDGHNVWCKEAGRSYCVMACEPRKPHIVFPPGDSALAILLTLRHNEPAFLAVAVVFGGVPRLRRIGRYDHPF